MFLCLLAGCQSGPTDALRAVVPDLSPEMARHLVHDDDEAFRQFAHASGEHAVREAYSLLVTTGTGSPSEYARVEAIVAPPIDRLVQVLSSDFHLQVVKTERAAFLRRSLTERAEIVQLHRQERRLAFDTETPIAEKERLYRQLIEASKPYAEAVNLGNLYWLYASLLPRLNRRDEMPQYLRLGVQAALQYPDHETACQLLGTLGAYHQSVLDFEAMRACWDQALALAREENSWQEARILGFYARHYQARGQLALARDLLLQAQDRCRELGGDDMELRFLSDSLQLFTSLECWDVVERGLQRAEVLLRRGQKQWSSGDADLYRARVQEVRARYLSALGRCQEAKKIAVDLARRVDVRQPSPATEKAALGAAQVLLTCARPRQALEILERVANNCRTFDMPELLEDCSIRMAEAHFMLGDWKKCQKALDEFRSHTEEQPSYNMAWNRIRHDALSIRVALQEQRRDAALERLGIALDGLQAQKRQLGASPEATIALTAADEIRDLAHQLLDGPEDSGYALEMAWRRSQARGSDSWITGASVRLASSLSDESRLLRERLAASKAIHCVFDVRSDSVVRWTASGSGVQRETLRPESGVLEARVAAVRTALAQQPTGRGKVDAELSRQLYELATWLLPEAVLGSAAPTLVLVSADGFLCRLPFEVLNLSATSFAPLLGRHDVAYLRFFGRDREDDRQEKAGHEAGRGPAILISQPSYPASLRRRYSILTEDLEQGKREAESFARLLSQPLSFSGAEATKRNLLERWQSARVLYFACHLIQDPETPYIVFIPMAQPASGHEEDAYLEVAEVRQADLSGCELVVLSSCASGAPYVHGRIASPSLGEAFVDAGAQAVVSTSWNVRDDAAARVMHEFADIYSQSGDPVQALCKVRRDLIRDQVDPHVWAAYSITLGGL